MKRYIAILCLTLACCAAQLAHASLVTIDFRSDVNPIFDFGVHRFANGDAWVDVQAFKSRPDGAGFEIRDDKLHQNRRGLGTGSGNNTINNDNGWENQWLSFAGSGRIVEFAITNFAPGEQLYVDGSTDFIFNGSAIGGAQIFNGASGLDLIDVSELAAPFLHVGTHRIQPNPLEDSRFRVGYVVMEVPEPGSSTLILLGLLALLWRRAAQ